MREVTKQAFFASVGQLDVIPTAQREASIWKLRHSGRVVGKMEPGYLGLGPKRYFVVDDL